MRNRLDALTPKDWNAIRDALEMRFKECTKLSAEMKSVHDGLSRTFQDTAQRAEETLTKLEELEIV